MGKGVSGKQQGKVSIGLDGKDHHTTCSAKKRQQSKMNASTILNKIYIKQK